MDDISTGALSLILFLLILISGCFSGSETSMMAINRYRLRHLVRTGHKGAKAVSKLLDKPERLIGLILLGNNFVNILASSIATIIGMRLFGDAGIAIATGVLTFVVLIFAEVTPKTIAALSPEKIAYPAAFVLNPLMRVLYPLVFLINQLTKVVLTMLGQRMDEERTEHLTREELRTVVNEAGSLIPKKHQSMMSSVLNLEKVTVEDIMVPRNEIIGIDINDDWKTIEQQLSAIQHTRIPIYKGSIDHLEGILHARKVLHLLSSSQKDRANKKAMLTRTREPLYVPQGTSLHNQLLSFQQHRKRIGIVVDEYGEIKGLVTLEDLLEEIVGEFTTDFSDTMMREVHPEEGGSYLVDGSATLRDLNKTMGWDLPLDGPKTINGLLLERLESIPEVGTTIKVNGTPIETVQVSDSSIKIVRIYPSLENDVSNLEETM